MLGRPAQRPAGPGAPASACPLDPRQPARRPARVRGVSRSGHRRCRRCASHGSLNAAVSSCGLTGRRARGRVRRLRRRDGQATRGRATAERPAAPALVRSGTIRVGTVLEHAGRLPGRSRRRASATRSTRRRCRGRRIQPFSRADQASKARSSATSHPHDRAGRVAAMRVSALAPGPYPAVEHWARERALRSRGARPPAVAAAARADRAGPSTRRRRRRDPPAARWQVGRVGRVTGRARVVAPVRSGTPSRPSMGTALRPGCCRRPRGRSSQRRSAGRMPAGASRARAR